MYIYIKVDRKYNFSTLFTVIGKTRNHKLKNSFYSCREKVELGTWDKKTQHFQPWGLEWPRENSAAAE